MNPHYSRRAALHLGGALLAQGLMSSTAAAQASWPDRPVKLVVTVGPGGAADTLARNLSNGFAAFANGQPLVVENRPGAGGTIAASMVASSSSPARWTSATARTPPRALRNGASRKC